MGDVSEGEGEPLRRGFDGRGTAALVTVVISWGTTPVLLKALTHFVAEPWTANGFRYLFAAALFWPFIVVQTARGRLPARVWGLALVPAAFSATGQVFFAWSHYWVDASIVGVLVKLSILFGVVGAMVVFRDERALLRRSRFWWGLAIALAGFVGLAVSRGVFEREIEAIGFALLLGASFGYGLYVVAVRRYLRDIHPITAFAVVAQYVAAILVVLMVSLGEPREVAGSLDLRGWALLLGSAVLGIFISHAVYYVAIRRLGVTVSMSAHFIGPFVTLVIASVALGETISVGDGWAAVVMLAGGAALVSAQGLVARNRA